ncbi:chemotaxis protein, partial [Pseudomonas syringae pv. tagetis]
QVHDLSHRLVNTSNSSIVGLDYQSARTNIVDPARNQNGAATQDIARNATDPTIQPSHAPTQPQDGQVQVEKTNKAITTLTAKI